jgi:hypothetical protein
MFLPLNYTDHQETDYYFVDYTSVVFTYFNESYLAGPELSLASGTRLLAAILMCIPAVYMNYKLRKSPSSHLDRNFSISIILGTIVLGWYFTRDFPPWELNWLFDPGYYWSSLWDLDRFSMIIITFLIIIPILIRETKIVGRLRQSQFENIDKVNTNQEIILESSEERFSRRYLILGVMLGLIAVIVPVQVYMSQFNLLPYPNNAFQFDSYTLFFRFSFENQPIPYETVRLHSRLISPGEMINQIPYAGFQLLFVYGILQYLQGNLSKKRIHLLGVLSLIVPFVYRLSAYIAHNSEGEYVIPFPVVLIIGLLVLRFVKPIDTTLQSREKSSPIEKDSIQTPIQYMIKSQILKLIKRISGNSERE